MRTGSYAMGAIRKLMGRSTNLVIGCSGGADSSALLYLAGKCKFENVIASQVVYDIRPTSETDEDIAAVAALVKRLPGVRHIVDRVTVPATGLNVEQFARDVRYTIFVAHAATLPGCKIATAHHADDQLETLLMRIARGTGVKGLRCIHEQRGNIIRPFLEMTKADILSICQRNKIEYKDDSTNSDVEYVRNFIREQICPLMRKINPGVARNATKLCRIAQTYDTERES